MITWWFDFVLLLSLLRCASSNVSAKDRPDKCDQCTCEPCSTSTQCPDTTCPTQNPSTPVCSCSSSEAVDCSKCSSSSSSTVMTTRDAITTVSEAKITETIPTTPQTKTTAAITTPTTSSSYSEQAEQESGLCLDNQAPSPGAIIGAAIGGTIFGSIITAIIFVYFRTSRNPYNSKNDQTSRVVKNAAYGHSIDNDQVKSLPVLVNSGYSEINDGMRKSAVISPILRQEDFSKIDQVYNHLGESEKEDRSDYYDHAGPAPSLSVVEDGYGVLSVESGGNDNYNTVDGNYSTDHVESITAENKQSDDYFILENQKE